jgi:hypothetical protein
VKNEGEAREFLQKALSSFYNGPYPELSYFISSAPSVSDPSHTHPYWEALGQDLKQIILGKLDVVAFEMVRATCTAERGGLVEKPPEKPSPPGSLSKVSISTSFLSLLLPLFSFFSILFSALSFLFLYG